MNNFILHPPLICLGSSLAVWRQDWVILVQIIIIFSTNIRIWNVHFQEMWRFGFEVWFRFWFRFVWFRLVSFRFDWFRFDLFRFVSISFRTLQVPSINTHKNYFTTLATPYPWVSCIILYLYLDWSYIRKQNDLLINILGHLSKLGWPVVICFRLSSSVNIWKLLTPSW
jgi:hypothetical protein